jgi:hypothetical protein
MTVTASRLLRWREATEECRRVHAEWVRLTAGQLAPVLAALGEKEVEHLRHTVYRINSFAFLYAKLIRRPHTTELGVLLGVITHLLDHAYDHSAGDGGRVTRVEDVVLQRCEPDPADALQVALAELARRAWHLVPAPQRLARRLDRMIDTQRRSMAQAAGNLDPAVLTRITWDKGHDSVCLYFAAVNPDFSDREAEALRSFGWYLQYMDDLEDLYEDRAESRQSPVAGPRAGVREARRAFRTARRDLARYYGADRCAYSYRPFMGWLVLFHLGIVLACYAREVVIRLPPVVQRGLRRQHQRLARRIPFFWVAPLSLPDQPVRRYAS